MMNRWTGIGNLTRDPEMRQTTTGKSVCNFTIAVNRTRNKNTQEVDYIGVVTWTQLADNCYSYLHKGSKVAVDGPLYIRQYERKDGSKGYVAEIYADHVDFLPSGSERGNNANFSADMIPAGVEEDFPF